MQKESGIPIGPANIGFDHYAFELDDRDDVDRLLAFLKRDEIVIVDPPADDPSYGEGYYAVFFLDPDGLKLEVVFFGEAKATQGISCRHPPLGSRASILPMSRARSTGLVS